jgi:hypothetical protein
MIQIEEYPCKNVNEARTRESYWIKFEKASLNKSTPGRTQKMWILDNKKELKQYHKEYNINNKEKIKQYREDNKEKIKQNYTKRSLTMFICECGAQCRISHKQRHLRTSKHKNFINLK